MSVWHPKDSQVLFTTDCYKVFFIQPNVLKVKM